MRVQKQIHGDIDTDQSRGGKNFNRLILYLAIGLLLIIAVYYIGRSIAAEPAGSNLPSSSCGARVANYSYQVPFSKNSPWNIPACNLSRHPQTVEYASRFYNWATKNANDGSASSIRARGLMTIGFGFEPLASNFSKTVYYAKDANRTIRVQTSVATSNLDKSKFSEYSNLPENSIPWNDKWETAQGGDNEMVILDDSNGRMYELWGVKKDLAAVGQCGPLFRDRLCVYSAMVSRDKDGNYADYRTFEGTTRSRGVGIPNYATLTTPEEVSAGEIRHALGVSIFASAFGPECSKAQLGTTAEMKTCGTAVAPASKFEWAKANSVAERLGTPNDPFSPIYNLEKTIPEGMRFALNIDDAYIENWINSRVDLKNNAKKAQTARIFARALRDYGFIITDTNGAISNIQVSGAVNPQSKQKWSDLGITEDKDDYLLEGLLNQNNIYTVETPTNQCSDGTTSKYYCYWTKSTYPSVSNQTSNTTPTTPTTTPTTNPSTTNEPVIPPLIPKPTTPTSNNYTPPQNQMVTPTTPRLSAELQMGFWTERFEFKYGFWLKFGGSTSPNGIKEYLIYKNGRQLAKINKTNYEDYWVGNGGQYTYSVRAVDTKGNLSQEAKITKKINCVWLFCSSK